jgi:hypothetical protein
MLQPVAETFHAVSAKTTAEPCRASSGAAPIVNVKPIYGSKTSPLNLVSQVCSVVGIVGAKPVSGMTFVAVIPKPWDGYRVSIKVATNGFHEPVGAKVNEAGEVNDEINAAAITKPFLLRFLNPLPKPLRVLRTFGPRPSSPAYHCPCISVVKRWVSRCIHEDDIARLKLRSLAPHPCDRPQQNPTDHFPHLFSLAFATKRHAKIVAPMLILAGEIWAKRLRGRVL